MILRKQNSISVLHKLLFDKKYDFRFTYIIETEGGKLVRKRKCFFLNSSVNFFFNQPVK